VIVIMNSTAPHYLLFTEAKDVSQTETGHGRWRFVLEKIGSSTRIEESDNEPGVRGERLQLLAVVRGLEVLEQRSRVTLITSSKYVGRGIRRGLTLWRQNDWQWERFGQMALIKNHDLWQRIDQAMQIHQINCRVWQFDPPHVRTQVPVESDLPELRQEGPSVLKLPVQTQILSTRSNHLKLNLHRSRQAFGEALEQVSRVSSLLADKVKPIGQGRAYGYAAN
jgi:ribonuclease HI